MSEATPTGTAVPELIRLREQLTGWISRLDEVGGQANTRVAERVRADYADRLRRVNEDLGTHREEIDADLERFRGALVAAEERRASAAEALEEVRLRHLIGELDDAAWGEARPELERDVTGADDAVAQARAEVERLELLSADIHGAAAAAPEEIEVVWTPEAEPAAPVESLPPAAEAAAERTAAEPAAPAEEPAARAEPAPPADAREAADAVSADEWDPFGGEFGTEEKKGDVGEDLPWLSGADDAAGWSPPAAEEESGLEFLRGIDEPAPPADAATGPTAEPATGGDLGADDLAFLEELDRSIGGARPPAGAAPQPPAPAEPQPPVPATGARAEPLLCKECGAINEPHSWYCEICGSEL